MLSRLFGSKPKSPVEFWAWFQANAPAFADPEKVPQDKVHELGRRLKEIDRGLAFEVAFPPNADPELAISANGDRRLFDAVRTVVAAAPAIPGWKVVAFRQPNFNPEMMVLELGNEQWDAAKLWARAKKVGQEIDLVIWAPNYADNRMHNDALLLLLDNTIGEELMGSRVRGVAFNRLEDETKPPHAEAVRLGKLRGQIV